jgi:hypothetical protein
VNVTIAIDDALLERARAYAAARGTSVQQLLRDELEKLVGGVNRDATADELMKLFREQPGDGRGHAYRREDAYEGRLG